MGCKTSETWDGENYCDGGVKKYLYIIASWMILEMTLARGMRNMNAFISRWMFEELYMELEDQLANPLDHARIKVAQKRGNIVTISNHVATECE